MSIKLNGTMGLGGKMTLSANNDGTGPGPGPVPIEPILDYASGEVYYDTLFEATTTFTSPEDAYIAWATELGLPTTGTLPDLLPPDDDDSHMNIITNVIPSKTGASDVIGTSSEGGVYTFHNSRFITSSSAGKPLVNTGNQTIARFFTSRAPNPSLVFTVKAPDDDNRYVMSDSRWQQTDNTVIIYMIWENWTTGANRVTSAYRFEKGKIDWVATNINAPVAYMQLFSFDETISFSTDVAPDPAGTSKSREITIGEVVRWTSDQTATPI